MQQMLILIQISSLSWIMHLESVFTVYLYALCSFEFCCKMDDSTLSFPHIYMLLANLNLSFGWLHLRLYVDGATTMSAQESEHQEMNSTVNSHTICS
jgi:hypothetical protein